MDPVSEDRFFPPYPILNHFETWHRARDENKAESRDELERRIEVDLFKLVQVVDFLILWCDDYYLRIEKLRPTVPTVTPQQALAADSLCQWLSDTVARYLILAEQQLIVSELLDPSAIHYPGPIPVDEILKEYPLGLR